MELRKARKRTLKVQEMAEVEEDGACEYLVGSLRFMIPPHSPKRRGVRVLRTQLVVQWSDSLAGCSAL